MTKIIKLLTSGYNAKITGYINNREIQERKVKDLDLKERVFNIKYENNEFSYTMISGTRSASLNLNKKKKEFLYFAGGKDIQHFIMSDEVYDELVKILLSMETEYYDFEIDNNIKHQFDISFGNFGTYTLSKTFDKVLRDRLCKELEISLDDWYNASRFICKYSKKKNGLTYDEIKEVVRMYQNHISKAYQDMYTHIQNKKSIQELREEGNDGLADFEELYNDLDKNNFNNFNI